MEEESPSRKGARRLGRRGIILIFCVIVFLAIAGSLTVFFLTRPAPSLLPAKIKQQIVGFTPYFYKQEVPAGYHMDTAHTSYTGGILFVPLVGPSGSNVVLTEQPWDNNINPDKLAQNGDKVLGTESPAVISSVEGRLVGIMMASANHTLIIFNTPDTTAKDDVSALLKGLRPLR